MTKPTVCVDFDGVLNTYTGWRGPDELFEPRPFAWMFLEDLAERFRVVILSTRSSDKIRAWLEKHRLDHLVDEVTNTKVAAVAYVDDRAIRFTGDFEQALESVRTLRPHWQTPVNPAPKPLTEDQIAEHVLQGVAEGFPADPKREDAWHLSDEDFRRALRLAVEMAREFPAPAAKINPAPPPADTAEEVNHP